MMRWALGQKGGASPRLVAAILLLASCLVGALAGIGIERAWLHPRGMWHGGPRGGPPHWPKGGDEGRRRREGMARELKLTPAQAAAIDSIFAQQSRRLETVREETRPRMEAILDSTRQRIDSLLTPDQRRRVQELRKRREEHRHGRWEP